MTRAQPSRVRPRSRLVLLLEGVLDFLAGLFDIGLNLVHLAIGLQFRVVGCPTRGLFGLALEFVDLVFGLVGETYYVLLSGTRRAWMFDRGDDCQAQTVAPDEEPVYECRS